MPRHVAGGPLWFLLHQWDSWRNDYLIRDIFVNVVLYIPLGLSANLAFPKRTALAPVLFALALSVSVELIQVYEPLRWASMVDLLCNTGGAALGVAIALLSRRLSIARTGAAPVDPGAVLLAAGFFACLLFPLLPLHSRAMIAQNTRVFLHSPLVSTFPAATALAIWYAAGLLLRGARVRFARVWLVLSLLTILLQVHILDQSALIAELAGAVAGVVLFALRPSGIRIARWEAWGVFLLTAMGGLWPFHFTAQTNGFSLVPFRDLITADGPTGLWIILSQFVAWGAAVWLFSSSGMRRWSAVALVTAIVAAAQLGRIFVADATPAITSPLLAVIAGYVLDALGQSSTELQTAGSLSSR